MKFTAKYKDGVLIPDRPIHPKGETVHLEILDEEIETPEESGAGDPARSAALKEEREKIRRLMGENPFLRELWKDLPMRPGREHGKSDDELLEEAISENSKYFPAEESKEETVNQRDRRRGFEFRAEWRRENGRHL